ncbi:MAG: hypothetical protein KJ712_08100, partial [Bacteroidetes bacterium]|nr:hypothetical protein [Bacteroidota bacterium]
MDMALIIVAVVILVIAVVLFLKRPVSASGIDISEFNQLKAAQENLRIQLAVSEQKVKSALDEKFDIEVKLNQRLEKLELERNNLIEQLTNE